LELCHLLLGTNEIMDPANRQCSLAEAAQVTFPQFSSRMLRAFFATTSRKEDAERYDII